MRPTKRSSTYVGAVAVSAGVGFVEQSPWPIAIAALLSLPTSIVAVPCYYAAYGVLARVSGANPSSNSGSSTSSADGSDITSVTTGMSAAWFTITTHVVGILTLSVAAALNVLLLRAIAARKREG